jgi:plasmid stabilization system protein ParE
MAQVIFSRNAASNLDRLYRFLSDKNPQAATRAIMTILERLGTLSRFPRMGRVDPDRPDTRELFMPLGAAGYVARYRLTEGVVTVMAVRHMREAGYTSTDK